MTTGTLKVTITDEEVIEFQALHTSCMDNDLFDKLEPYMVTPMVAASDMMKHKGLPVDSMDRIARLATIGEMFLAHLHSAMEAEVAELPQ